jgi:uncharacterized protein YkwD
MNAIRRSARAVLASLVVGLSVLVAPAPAAHADASFDTEMLALINQDRAANGLGPLQAQPLIGAIAEDAPYLGCGYPVAGRAADMGNRNYFSHTILNCGTQTVFDMLRASLVPFLSAAENIGWEQGTTDPGTAARVLNDQFMNSPGHRANILDPNVTHVGVGSWHTEAAQTWSGAGGARGNVYVTAVVFSRLSVTLPPSAPTNVVATPGTGQITVSWSPANGNGGAVDAYIVYAMGPTGYSGRYVSVCGTCTSAVVGALGNGVPYWTLVYAHNAVGWGAGTASGWVTVGAPLAPPAAGVNAGGGGGGQASVWWSPARSDGPAVDAYAAVAYDGTGFTGQYAYACGTCTSTTVSGFVPGHQYVLAVVAHNAWGWSAPAFTAWFTA